MSEPLIRPAVPADAERLASIHVTSWRETYAGLMPDGFLDDMTGEAMRERRTRNWAYSMDRNLDVVWVAVLDGQVVGFASAGAVAPHTVIPGDYDAELYTLYALKSAHGHGLGRALLRAVAGDLQGRGFAALALWVLTANSTREFYAHLGARELGQKRVEVPGGELLETAMGWRTLDGLR